MAGEGGFSPEEAKPSQLLRQISKEQSPQERSELAGAIRGKRNEYFDRKKGLQQDQENIAQKRETGATMLETKLEELTSLEGTISELSSNWFSRVWNRSALKNANTELIDVQESVQTLQDYKIYIAEEEQKVSEKLAQKGRPAEFDKAKKMLDEFYGREEKKWISRGHSREEIVKYFSPDFLRTLSNEDFITLMRRFPSEMVTHVTRQGVRDHLSGDFHTAGFGEYATGFMDILGEGKLKSAFGIYLKDGVTKEAIAKCLDIGDTINDRKSALQYLDIIIHGGSNPGSYGDRTAVHFAAESVADYLYGSETGNEIFFVFPSAYIASQHFFKGQLSDGSGGTHNDQWVWPDGTEGIPLEAGVVFIPAGARVDRRTGSKYELDANNWPIQKEVLSNGTVSYKESSDTVTSQEYWESYFNQHHDKRPQRIVYYKGDDPTSAVMQWREANGLSVRSDRTDLGFNERHIHSDDPTANKGIERFESLAKEVIDEYFPPQANPQLAEAA